MLERRALVPQIYAGLFLLGELIGNIKMQHKTSLTIDANSTQNLVHNYNVVNSTSNFLQSADMKDSVSLDSGTIVNPQDNRYILTCQ